MKYYYKSFVSTVNYDIETDEWFGVASNYQEREPVGNLVYYEYNDVHKHWRCKKKEDIVDTIKNAVDNE